MSVCNIHIKPAIGYMWEPYAYYVAAGRALKQHGFSRNKACICGSGIKFKHCHLPKFVPSNGELDIAMTEMGFIYD